MSTGVNANVSRLLRVVVLRTRLLRLGTSATNQTGKCVLRSDLRGNHKPITAILTRRNAVDINSFFIYKSSAKHIDSLVSSRNTHIADVNTSRPIHMTNFSRLTRTKSCFRIMSGSSCLGSHTTNISHRSIPTTSLIGRGTVGLIMGTSGRSSHRTLIRTVTGLSGGCSGPFTIVDTAVNSIGRDSVGLTRTSKSEVMYLRYGVSPFIIRTTQRRRIAVRSFSVVCGLLRQLRRVTSSCGIGRIVHAGANRTRIQGIFSVGKRKVVTNYCIGSNHFIGSNVVVT